MLPQALISNAYAFLAEVKNLGMGGCNYWITSSHERIDITRYQLKCTNKNHNLNGYVSHNNPYISNSKIMWHLPCHGYTGRDDCVEHSDLRCGLYIRAVLNATLVVL